MNNDLKYTNVVVNIPNLDGDGIVETHSVKVPVTIDPHTGEELLTEEAIRLMDDTKARYMGLLLPPEFKKMRERLGLTQKRISELLQSGEKSWTRWESGRSRPSRMVNVLLRLIYEGKVFVSDLIAQRNQGVNWRKMIKFQPQTQRPEIAECDQAKWAYAGSGLSPPATCQIQSC